MKAPDKVPALGFYYHYKHDSSKPANDYAYDVVGVGAHTEEEGVFMVIYRPIYESSVYKAGRLFDIRPLEMWIGDVNKDGSTFPRFKKIEDSKVINELTKIRDEMYK